MQTLGSLIFLLLLSFSESDQYFSWSLNFAKSRIHPFSGFEHTLMFYSPGNENFRSERDRDQPSAFPGEHWSSLQLSCALQRTSSRQVWKARVVLAPDLPWKWRDTVNSHSMSLWVVRHAWRCLVCLWWLHYQILFLYNYSFWHIRIQGQLLLWCSVAPVFLCCSCIDYFSFICVASLLH